MIVLNLKELGVKKLLQKLQIKDTGKFLEKVGADKIIYPEEYMGKRVAELSMDANIVEHLKIYRWFYFSWKWKRQ